MATYQFSALSDGQSIAFNPNADVLNFNDDGIAAGHLRVTAEGAHLRVTVVEGPNSGKDVLLLNTSAQQLYVANVTFQDGSGLRFGDDSASTAGDNAAQTLIGTAGGDLLQGFGGADTLQGGDGNDVYYVGTGDVISDSGGIDWVLSDVSWTAGQTTGVDYITLTGTGAIGAEGNNLDNLLIGNNANNVLNGRAGHDTLIGNGGNDVFNISAGGTTSYGNDSIDGGSGNDAIDFVGSNALSAVMVDLGAGTASGGGSTMTLVSIETAVGGAFGDSLRGSSVANGLYGVAGNDTLNGLGGNDTLSGGVGNDSFEFSTAPGAGNVDIVTDFVSGAEKLRFDNSVFSATGAQGNFAAGDGRFWAAAGATSGHDANDRIIFNTTTRSLYYDADGSGAGAAQLIATFQGSSPIAATDIVVFGGVSTTPTNGDDSLTGTSGDDTIDGLGGNDTITGMGGNDLLRGGTGNDVFRMGNHAAPGVDRFEGGDGIDTIDYSDAHSGIRADLSETGIDGGGDGGVGRATQSGVENFIGGAFDDRIVGSEAANRLEGGAGNDSLAGEAGLDTLVGGSGADVFELQGAGTADLLADFAPGTDTIQVNGISLGAIGRGGDFAAGDGRFHAAAGATAGHDADDRLIYDTSTGNLYYDADGNGSQAAQLLATLQGAPGLAATDITVVQGQDTGTPDSRGIVTSFAASSDPEIDALLTPFKYKWGLEGAGSGTSLTFSFRNEDSRYSESGYGPDSEPYSFWSPMSESNMEAIRDVLDLIAEIANLEFTELVDSATVAGDLRFGNTSYDRPGAAAWASYPLETVNAGDVWFRSAWNGDDDDPGSWAFHLIMHEIGHALGLKHPFDDSPVLDPSRDNNDYTVMAYTPSPGGTFFEHTPMLLDVAALQYIYGANMETRAGDDLYSWSIGEPIYETLWDAGGIDTLDWSNQSQAATIDLSAGSWSDVGPSRGNTDRNFMIAYGAVIENALGGTGADSLVGNAFANSLSGGLGNDVLNGGAGVDTLIGGAGSDGFFFDQPGTGGDQIADFASGIDRIRLDGSTFTGLGTAGNFSAGDARFHAAPGANAAHDADDRIIYNTTTGQLWYDADGNGAGAAPQLIAVLQPGAALAATDLQVDGPDGSQVINGTSGNDSLVGGSGNDTLNGLGGNDTLEGMDGDDSLSGGDGNDVLDGGEGDDTLNGGAGDDTYLNPEFFDDVIVDAAGIDTAIIDQDGYSLPDGIENLTVRGVEDDFDWNVAGNALDNVITIGDGRRWTWVNGRDGDDTLIGGAGSERFELYNTASGDYGNDVIDAGDSDFDVIFFPGDSAIVLDMRTGTAVGGGTGGSGSLVFSGIDYVLTSGHFHDHMTADDSGVTMKGGGGDDTLIGGAGDDFLDGEGVWEMWSGETGNDSIFGGAGNDTIDGWNGDNFIDAGTGDDVVLMNGFEGEYGHNTIDGGEGEDTLEVVGFDVVVDLAAGTLTGGNDDRSGSASLSGIEHLAGGGEFHGDAGANRLEGGGILDGREGNDTLSGWFSNADYTAVFSVAPGVANADVLVDFDSMADRIHLQTGAHAGIGAVGQFADGDARFWAAAGANAGHDADDRVVYNTTTGQLWYDADGSGAGMAQLIATVEGAPTLAARDIWSVPDSSGGGVNLVGTEGNDSLTGTGLNDTIDGLGGHDTLHGVAGSDLLIGGAGNDSLVGGQDSADPWSDDGHDTLVGGDGNDTLNGAPQVGGTTPRNTDTLDGGAGDDLYLVDLEGDTVVDSGGVDMVNAMDTSFTLGDGIENLHLMVGFSEGATGIGNDLANWIAGSWQVRIEGRGGNDTILGSGRNDFLFGDDGDDFLLGEQGRDQIQGGAGNDTLDGGSEGAADTLTGGLGADLFLANWASALITDFASGTDKLQFDGLRFVNPGASGNFTAGDQRFHSGAGVTAAHDASDRVIYDTITGDLYYDEDGTGSAEAQFVANVQGIVATDITVINGSGGTPPIQGTSGNDSIVGTAGNDTIDGLAGNDTMDGLGGDDVFLMNGTYGADRTFGRDGVDTVNFAGATGAINASIVGSFASGGGGSVGLFTIENLVGSGFNDTLTGDANANRLEGGAGNDTITGREGNDELLGGDGNDVFIQHSGGGSYGNDTIDGGAGTDTLEFGSIGRSGIVTDLTFGTLTGGGTGGAGSGTLVNIENVIGTAYADRIRGDNGNNALTGSNGNDTLAGNYGNDTLSGGVGADFFDFDADPGATNVDHVLDFATGSDTLRFVAEAFPNSGSLGDLAAGDGRFWAAAGVTSGHDATDRWVYNTSTGSLYYDADGNGAGASTLIATFQGNPALAATDFAVI